LWLCSPVAISQTRVDTDAGRLTELERPVLTPGNSLIRMVRNEFSLVCNSTNTLPARRWPDMRLVHQSDSAGELVWVVGLASGDGFSCDIEATINVAPLTDIRLDEGEPVEASLQVFMIGDVLATGEWDRTFRPEGPPMRRGLVSDH
jgi:hypothetical protein